MCFRLQLQMALIGAILLKLQSMQPTEILSHLEPTRARSDVLLPCCLYPDHVVRGDFLLVFQFASEGLCATLLLTTNIIKDLNKNIKFKLWNMKNFPFK